MTSPAPLPGLGPLGTRIWHAAPFLERVPPEAAGRDARAGAIQKRRAEDHLCLLCGGQARAAIIARPRGSWPGPYWVDLCWACYTGVLAES